jgi:hypothetical protein
MQHHLDNCRSNAHVHGETKNSKHAHKSKKTNKMFEKLMMQRTLLLHNASPLFQYLSMNLDIILSTGMNSNSIQYFGRLLICINTIPL